MKAFLVCFFPSIVFGVFWGREKPVSAPLCKVPGKRQQEGLREGLCSETLAPAPSARQVPWGPRGRWCAGSTGMGMEHSREDVEAGKVDTGRQRPTEREREREIPRFGVGRDRGSEETKGRRGSWFCAQSCGLSWGPQEENLGFLGAAYSPFCVPFQTLRADQGPHVCWGQLCTSPQGPGTTS